MKGMLLAAGLSTRLGPLGEERPKPMLPMLDVPLVRYGLHLLRKAGIVEVAVNLHHQGEQIQDELGGEVVYSHEPEILGTGGGVRRMAEILGEDCFVVVNAKVVADLDLHAVLKAHKKSGAMATMVVRPDANAQRWGAVDVGPDRRVRGMLGEGSHMFTGIHVLEPEFVRAIPQGTCDIVRTAYADLLARGAPIFAHVQGQKALFAENSTAERYLDANLQILGCGAPFPWPTWGVDLTAKVEAQAHVRRSARVGPGARVGRGARVERSVIGHGAVVSPETEVVESVVWPGAVVTRSVHGAIVTPRQHVQVRNPPSNSGSGLSGGVK